MIRKIRKQIEAGELTFEQVTARYLEIIGRQEPTVHAFLSVNEQSALEVSRDLDRRRRSGATLGPLAGIPVAVKDNLCTKGIRTTCASRMLENFIPPYNATVVEKLLAADAVILGKTNLDEFAMGSSTENSYFGPTHNPADPAYIPGGSSGGSAAAVAAREAVVSLGSDTGGSIRQPASHCGVVGLKPTYGRVSRYGLVAFASSLDQIGPFAACVEDAALLLHVIAGHDPGDSTSIPDPVPDYMIGLESGVKGLRIGVPKEYFGHGLRKEIADAIMARLRALEKEGARLVEVSMPTLEYAVAVYYIICTAEASSNLARYDGVKYGYRTENENGLMELYCRTRQEGFGREVKRRIMLGTYVLSSGYYDAYYLKALKARTLIIRDYEKAWETCDVIASPVTPAPAFRLGEKTEDPLQMYLSDIYTISVNLAGLPGISVPCDRIGNLPFGIQFVGKVLDEATLFQVARAAERLGSEK